jgi:hypothetical protein
VPQGAPASVQGQRESAEPRQPLRSHIGSLRHQRLSVLLPGAKNLPFHAVSSRRRVIRSLLARVSSTDRHGGRGAMKEAGKLRRRPSMKQRPTWLALLAHGATHFTGNASHRERQDEEEADNNERQRAGSQQVIFPIELHHERAAVSAIPWRRTLQRLPQCYSRRVHR